MPRLKLRGKTAALMASENPILASREPAMTTDTGILKIGDGVTPWNALPGISGGGGGESYGKELGYMERVSNFTTTNTAAGNAAGIITGLSITFEGEGRPVDIEFEGLIVHTTANTTITAALIDNGVNTGFYAGKSSPSNTLGETLYFKRRIPPIAIGVSKTYQIALSGAVAGTTSVLAIAGTSPCFLQATGR